VDEGLSSIFSIASFDRKMVKFIIGPIMYNGLESAGCRFDFLAYS
jgi:hypothetical protein